MSENVYICQCVIRKCVLYKWPDYPGYGFGIGIGERGAFVDMLEPNSPADLTSVKYNDRILQINGEYQALTPQFKARSAKSTINP